MTAKDPDLTNFFSRTVSNTINRERYMKILK